MEKGGGEIACYGASLLVYLLINAGDALSDQHLGYMEEMGKSRLDESITHRHLARYTDSNLFEMGNRRKVSMPFIKTLVIGDQSPENHFVIHHVKLQWYRRKKS